MSFSQKGHNVVVVTRQVPEHSKFAAQAVQFVTMKDLPAAVKSTEFDAVVHLAGEPLFPGRWTAKKKSALIASRVELLEKILNVFRVAQKTPQVVVSASAIGFYGNRGSEICTETSTPGDDFLASLCHEWERVALQKSRESFPSVRAVVLRLGVILAPEGGVLSKLTKLFQLGMGSQLGSGQQWMSWVAIEDACRAVLWAVEQESAEGAYNVVAPKPATNKDFTRALADSVSRWVFPVPTPACLLRMFFGEAASVVLSSQRVSSQKLEESGFVFEHRTIEDVLKRPPNTNASPKHS
jgi:uncharacterized protein (TIGR01777 family)